MSSIVLVSSLYNLFNCVSSSCVQGSPAFLNIISISIMLFIKNDFNYFQFYFNSNHTLQYLQVSKLILFLVEKSIATVSWLKLS